MKILALSAENQASFVCPIFDVPTQMRACVKLRDMFMRGEKPQVRKGCQACMASGKCPAYEVIRRFAFNSATSEDDLSSTTETTVKLPASVLARIAPVMVMPATMTAYRITDAEQQMIESSRERIEAQLRTAPRGEKAIRTMRQASQPEPRKATKIGKVPDAPKVEPTINKAAASGDLSAAINT